MPAGTPDEIVDKMRTEITALAKTSELQERLIKLGIVPGGLRREETAAVFRKDKELRRIREGRRHFAAAIAQCNLIASSSSAPGRSG